MPWRRRKLTPEKVDELLAWWESPRTPAQKAEQLGISVPTLYAYVKGRHKEPKQPIDIEALAQEITLLSVKVPRETKVSA